MRLIGLRAVVLLLLAGCGPRVGDADDDDAKSQSTGSDASASSGAASSSAQGSEAPTGDGMEIPYPDCRPIFFGGVGDCMSAYSATAKEAYVDFACGACACTEFCESDADCIDRGAPLPPRCVPLANPEYRACFVVCESDADCPMEMVCLPSEHLSERACYFPLLKPECCDWMGGC